MTRKPFVQADFDALVGSYRLARPEVPRETCEALARYVEHGVEPGGFLAAVLANDLVIACGHASFATRAIIWHVVDLIYNEIPASSWGSPEKVAAWIAEHEGG